MVLNCNMSSITVGVAYARQCVVPGSPVVLLAVTKRFCVRFRLGGLKIAIEIHKYVMHKNHMYSHKCSFVGNTNINWGEMACPHCNVMANAQLKHGAQKYEFVIRT